MTRIPRRSTTTKRDSREREIVKVFETFIDIIEIIIRRL